MDYKHFQLWSEMLSNELLGYYFDFGISFTKDSLILNFKGPKKSEKSFEFKFVEGQISLFPARPVSGDSRTKRNSVIQFRELENKELTAIRLNFLDRLMVFDFGTEYSLVFKGFGRFSNVVLWHQNTETVDSIFRLHLKSDWDFQLNQELRLPIIYSLSTDDSISSNIVKNVQSLDVLSEKVGSDLCISPEKWMQFIKTVKYDEINKIFDADVLTANTFMSFENSIIENKVATAEPIQFHVFLNRITQKLDVDQLNMRWENYLKQTSQIISAFYFEKNRDSRIGQCKATIKSLKTHLKQLNSRIHEIQNRRSFKELGDILISNCHAIKPGVAEPLLYDYYTDQRIRIKINPELSCAENAERFYKKSKKESIELEVLSKQLQEADQKLLKSETLLERLEQCQNHSDLQALKNFELPSTTKKSKQSDNLPYKLHVYDGFEIWQGKSSKSNDEMLKLASKNDLWFHAADFSGSHVIIRKKGKNYPTPLIQYAAKLAGLNSKGKNQSLLTVMYTERKFVSKPKGSHPGEVSVFKFETLDVVLK
jgi:predicted ribosome quality control (RQC) complex YloA/Tae2 family protein